MSEAPELTVVVPTHARPERLRACLSAIGRLETTAVVEVVIADDSGIVEPAAAQEIVGARLDLRVIESGGGGPGAARNAGATVARAPFVAFTDDDCEPQAGWAEALLDRHRAEPGALIGGGIVNGLIENPYSRAAQAITDAALAHHNGGPHGPRFFPSSNLAVPADRFAELGGFDEAVRLAGGEDRDFCERWVERGWPVAAAPDALVRHSHELGLRSFWRQQAAYGAGAYRHRRTRAARTGDRRLEPSLTSGVFGIAARRAIADRDAGRLALLGVWQAANAAGFARAALGRAQT